MVFIGKFKKKKNSVLYSAFAGYNFSNVEEKYRKFGDFGFE
jgi:hypothetical protein